jgi:hypothetical protein
MPISAAMLVKKTLGIDEPTVGAISGIPKSWEISVII